MCSQCPRRCNALRTENENINGFCKMPLLPKVARADLHFWEEPVISGENGSGTVFFSGCSLGCVYCQNEEISHKGKGKIISYRQLADIFRELELKGAHNINLVNPTHYTYAIRKALEIYKPSIPIVYNSGGYDTESQLEILADYIDIYLMDLKYLNLENALKYSLASDYPEIAKRAIKKAVGLQPEVEIENGIMKKGVIIRHLILPSQTREAMAVFDYVNKNFKNTYFSLMSQYIPIGKALNMPPINRKITDREYNKVLDYICATDFENIFIQERKSADKKYIRKKKEGI